MNEAELSLPNEIPLCHELIRQQADSLQKAQRRIEQLEHAMDVLLRQKYGPRSERLDPNQLRLFTEEADEPLPPAEPDIEPESPAKPKRAWKRRGRQTLPEHLPRVPVVIDVPEDERACPVVAGFAFTSATRSVSNSTTLRPRFSSVNSSVASTLVGPARSMWRSRPRRLNRSRRGWLVRVFWLM